MKWTNCLDNNLVVVLFFFFFQAEDGIRDLTVTGVQTCAIPISEDFLYPLPKIAEIFDCFAGAEWFTTLDLARGYWQIAMHPDSMKYTAFIRSEERRVGKECRSRWSADH